METLRDIKGIGEKIEKYLNKLGIYIPSDLLYFFPRDYEEFREPKRIIDLKVGEIETIRVKIISKPNIFRKRNLNITYVLVTDGERKIRVNWFNIPFISNSLIVGKILIMRGKVIVSNNGLTLNQPRIYEEDKYKEIKNTLSPIYKLTKGISNETIKKILKYVILEKNDFIFDYIPSEIRNKRELAELDFAIEHMHFPKDLNDCMVARKRLVYDELFIFSLALTKFKNEEKKKKSGNLQNGNIDLIKKIIENLPFELTKGQNDVVFKVIKNMQDGKIINSLLQGDVGSGKTIVSFLISIYVVSCGYQVAIMAPTEILANQHFEKLKKIINDNSLNINIAFLSGSLKVKMRREILKDLRDGKINIIIGTHALFSKDVIFKNLNFIVTDEQHRFGVMQRSELESKSDILNVLVMSATPIPRTLAMLLYADMDILIIKDKPINRLEIKNKIVKDSDREKVYKFIDGEIKMGHQAYVVCPSIESSDECGNFANFQNVVDYEKKLKEFFKKINRNIRIGILHGKMSSELKEKTINDFSNGQIDILISTTVIEVGIDCKNATVMVVEDAGRFGLSQLHQLRGRVGRGEFQSYAIFIDTTNTDKSIERLEVLKNSNDGFFISEADLKLRGPGDIFGVKQSGSIEFNIANIYNDMNILKMAFADAKRVLNNEISLKPSEKSAIKLKLDEYSKHSYTI